MSQRSDVLFVTPPSRVQVYQSLSRDLAAIEPPVWAGMMASFIRDRGYDVGILDAEAKGFTHVQTAHAIAQADPCLVVFVIYGQQPSASTQCMPAGRRVCEELRDLSDACRAAGCGLRSSPRRSSLAQGPPRGAELPNRHARRVQ